MGRFVNSLFFSAEFLKFVQAEEISYPSISFPVAIGFVVISVIDRPRQLRNRVNDPQKEPEDSVQPCCFEQRSMTAIVHQRKTSQREQAENDQKRRSEPERHRRSLKHEPPQQPVWNQRVGNLKQSPCVASFAEGLQREILV